MLLRLIPDSLHKGAFHPDSQEDVHHEQVKILPVLLPSPDAVGNYIFTSEAKDSTIKATFKKQQFALTDATTETNGTVSIMSGSTDVNKQKLDWGTPVTVTVAPKENWDIDKVTIDGKDISEFADTVLHTMSLLSANACCYI